jgi:predicted deacetylase
MSAKFVIRFDDITPGMAWSKFEYLEQRMIALNIKPIVGVVPQCLDPKLSVEPKREDFWDKLRYWQSLGWTIAQHGFTHQYCTSDFGLLKINSRSEFSGLSYKEQFKKLQAGKEILLKEKVWQPIFMAPAHSFDMTTCKALNDLDFKFLTDGYGVYPYKISKLTALPNLFSTPKHFNFGVYTICLHINYMSEQEIQKLLIFIEKNSEKFISFEEGLKISSPVYGFNTVMRYILFSALFIYRFIIRMDGK